jgi:surface polysaccharide O-acyltransferase-like enzyme
MKPSVFETPTSNLYYKGVHEIISLQVLKALAAFAVVMLHTILWHKGLFYPICILAVPVFFMITGYFLLNKEGILTLDRIKRTFLKILKLDIIATLLFLLCSPRDNILSYIERPRLILWLIAFGYNHLWYLHALLQALIVLYLLLKWKLLRALPVLVALGLFINLFIGDYSIFWTKFVFMRCFNRNFFTVALPCLYFGMLCRRNESKISYSSLQLGLITIILLLLSYLEFQFVFHRGHSGDVQFFTVPAAVCTFIWAIKTPALNRFRWLAEIGRKDSLNIYILHWLVFEWLRKTPFASDKFEWVEVSILTLLISILLRKVTSWIKAKGQH